MSKPSAKTSHKRIASRPKVPTATSDRTYYAGFAIIGAFSVFLVSLLTEGDFWKEAAGVYMALVAFQVSFSAFSVYRGRVPPAGWQRALARLPLRCAGYGVKGGHPIEAAHGEPKVLKVIIAGILFSVVVLAGLAAWLWWTKYR